jgi:hypothetical protein
MPFQNTVTDRIQDGMANPARAELASNIDPARLREAVRSHPFRKKRGKDGAPKSYS